MTPDDSFVPPIRFGIDSLDWLIAPTDAEPFSAATPGMWTAAIVGPDGCGKSILALHAAAAYYDRHNSEATQPRVIYISTDLSIDQARAQWEHFGLDHPKWRREVVAASYDNRDADYGGVLPHPVASLDLIEVSPSVSPDEPGKADDNYHRLTTCVNNDDTVPGVFFFDLQANTAGDDWGFVNHLVGLLPRREQNEPKHLLIIDAIEGLEAFVGRRDAFGLTRERRSRVAQLVRRANDIGVHVVAIVEEPKANARLPEQFVADLVIRLRHVMDGNYAQRTVEIEKCRAVAHIRGQHEFGIRHGRGSFSGTLPNLDDPVIVWKRLTSRTTPPTLELCGENIQGRFQLPTRYWEQFLVKSSRTFDSTRVRFLSHIHVVPSLYCQNRQVRESRARVPSLARSAQFGLGPLDEMLKASTVGSKNLRGGSITVLTGETGTMKGRLGRSFLAQAFSDGHGGICADMSPATTKAGVALLMTSKYLDQRTLVKNLLRHLRGADELALATEEHITKRVFCHRFGTRHLTSGAFLQLLYRYIVEAQKLVLGYKRFNNKPNRDLEQLGVTRRRKESHRIRIVLEDWAQLLSMYPNLRQEPLLLSAVVHLFRREGVSALIASTQSGSPQAVIGTDPYELRNLTDDTHILTWRVPFYGDRRTAITVHTVAGVDVPQRTPYICELEPARGDAERLHVTRHFDMYADVDIGKPHRVPLVVRLYLGNHLAGDAESMAPQYIRLLKDTFEQLFAAPAESREMITCEPYSEYERLSTFTDVLDDSHLDHTLVFQVDEFWSVEQKRGFYDLTPYWSGTHVSSMECTYGGASGALRVDVLRSDEYEDPKAIYLPHRTMLSGVDMFNGVPNITGRKDSLEEGVDPAGAAATDLTVSKRIAFQRRDFFIGGGDLGPQLHKERISTSRCYRVPYLWDFGIILADRSLWKRHAALQSHETELWRIWNSLCPATHDNGLCIRPAKDVTEEDLRRREEVSWPKFLTACDMIAEVENIPAFDVDLSTMESLSCWIFELWASFQFALDKGASPFSQLEQKTPPLEALIENCRSSLYQALAILVYYCPQLRSRNRQVFREHVSPRAVASREWYHTASAIMKRDPNSNYVPLANPGNYAVRGDWHIAVAQGSRSEVLAHRTLDILASRRQNLLRMQEGIGLPVRDVLPDEQIGELPTAMSCIVESQERGMTLSYENICGLGPNKGRENLRWLWRSAIKHYARDSFYWRRWIARMIEEKHHWFRPSIGTPENMREEVTMQSFDSNWRKRFDIGDGDIGEGKENRKRQELYKELASSQRGFEQRCQIIESAVRDQRFSSMNDDS